METEAFLAMAEAMKALELQLDLAKKRIEELEKELSNDKKDAIKITG